MKIGSGWQKNNDAGDTFISVALDEVLLEQYPFLKKCNISLSWVKAEKRTSENYPDWTLSITAKKPKEEKTPGGKKEETTPATKTTVASEELPSVEEIPY